MQLDDVESRQGASCIPVPPGTDDTMGADNTEDRIIKEARRDDPKEGGRTGKQHEYMGKWSKSNPNVEIQSRQCIEYCDRTECEQIQGIFFYFLLQIHCQANEIL